MAPSVRASYVCDRQRQVASHVCDSRWQVGGLYLIHKAEHWYSFRSICCLWEWEIVKAVYSVHLKQDITHNALWGKKLIREGDSLMPENKLDYESYWAAEVSLTEN